MSDPARHPIGILGIINLGLSFLMPYMAVNVLLGGAFFVWTVQSGSSMPSETGIWAIIFVSTAVGAINAVGYYRRKYGGQAK